MEYVVFSIIGILSLVMTPISAFFSVLFDPISYVFFFIFILIGFFVQKWFQKLTYKYYIGIFISVLIGVLYLYVIPQMRGMSSSLFHPSYILYISVRIIIATIFNILFMYLGMSLGKKFTHHR